MSNSIKQISVLQRNGSYVSQPIGADAKNIDIDATHTLADKARSWDSKANSSDLDNYVPVTAKGAANGVATLDAEGKILEEQIPGGIQPTIEIDPAPAQGSENAVSSGGVYTALGEKVNRVNGKGLSTNDYTNEEKTKLEGIELNAEVNVINSISVNGTPQPVTNKNIDLTIGEGGVLPIASTNTLGGVKIGSGLNIDSNGVLTTSNSNENTSNISFQRLDTTEISKNKYSINTDYGLIYIQLTRFISEGSGSPFGTNYYYTFMIDASNFEAYAEESPGTYYHVLTQGDITLKLSHGPGSSWDNAELQNITAEIIDNDDNTWHLIASVLTT